MHARVEQTDRLAAFNVVHVHKATLGAREDHHGRVRNRTGGGHSCRASTRGVTVHVCAEVLLWWRTEAFVQFIKGQGHVLGVRLPTGPCPASAHFRVPAR